MQQLALPRQLGGGSPEFGDATKLQL